MSLINPNFPHAAIGFRGESVSVVDLQKQSGQFVLRSAATIELSKGVLQPDFFEENLVVPNEILGAMREAVENAGLNNQKKWSVSLPAGSAQMGVLTLEAKPKSSKELREVLSWKAERTFGAKPDEMRLGFQPLVPDADKRIRYFAVAIKNDVLAEYEDLFNVLGWQVGLILPRHVSEANWLMLQRNVRKQQGDALMVSSQPDGFTAILMRQSQPAVVRSVICEANEREDELYRLLLFYRDRFDAEIIGADNQLKKLLLIGNGFPPERVHQIADETLGYDLEILGADEIGLALPNEIRFEDVAAPAGLASLAWR